MKFLKSIVCAALFISTVAHGAEITVVEQTAWARATPPNAKTTAIYLSLENHTDSNISLIAAKSNISDRLELHTHLQEDGMMKMRQVDMITAAPSSVVDLKPHGLHIMVFDLSKTLVEGETIELELLFDDQTTLELNVPISKERPASEHTGADDGQMPTKHKEQHDMQQHDVKENEHSN